MTENPTQSGSGTDELDPETEATRLEAVEQYFEYMRDTTPYYDWLEANVDTVERGVVRVHQPYTDRVTPPEVGPDTGINAGVLMTLIDAAAMGAIIAEGLEPVPLATTDVSVSLHDGVAADHLIEGEVIDFGDTLATARVRAYPEADRDEPDPRIVASGQATARLFD